MKRLLLATLTCLLVTGCGREAALDSPSETRPRAAFIVYDESLCSLIALERTYVKRLEDTLVFYQDQSCTTELGRAGHGENSQMLWADANGELTRSSKVQVFKYFNGFKKKDSEYQDTDVDATYLRFDIY